MIDHSRSFHSASMIPVSSSVPHHHQRAKTQGNTPTHPPPVGCKANCQADFSTTWRVTNAESDASVCRRRMDEIDTARCRISTISYRYSYGDLSKTTACIFVVNAHRWVCVPLLFWRKCARKPSPLGCVCGRVAAGHILSIQPGRIIFLSDRVSF